MNNTLDNDVSALMDDELPPQARQELYQALKNDAVLLEKWSRYHLIRDTLTNHLPDTVSLDLADRVRAAIDAEPTHFLPQKRQLPPPEAQPEAASAKPRLGWFMPAAAAATVAAVAILGFQLDRGQEGAMMTAAPAGAEVQRLAVESPPQWLRGAPPDVNTLAEHLASGSARQGAADRYLVDHNGVAAGAGVSSVFPYARMVSHDISGGR